MKVTPLLLALLAMLSLSSAFALEVRVRQTPNGPRIFKDGVEVSPRMFYGTDERRQPDDNRDGLDTPFAKQILMAKEQGVDFITFNSIAPYKVWIDDHTYDFHNLDRTIDLILKLNPKALFIPRVDINARSFWETGFWLKRHPDLCMKFDPKGEDVPGVPSVSSPLYRQEACEYLKALIEHLEKKYPNNFAGIHPSAQETCEFFYWNSWHRMSGFEDAVTQAFGAPSPSYEARCHATHGSLRDPVKDADAFRFTVRRNREMADFIAQLAQTCREATQGKKLVLFFYGYSWIFLSSNIGAAETGHYAVGHLLKKAAGNIDILVSPITYSDRAPGNLGTCMSAADTIVRNGIMWFNEDDIRTYRTSNHEYEQRHGQCEGLDESVGVMRRQLAHEAIAGYGNWFMDLPGSGWFEDPELWKTVKQVKPLEEAVSKRNRGYQPEMALILDEESICAITQGNFAGPMVASVRADLARNGVSFGQYLLSDFMTDNLPFAKVHWFQAAWYLTESERAALKEFRKNDKGIRVWSWAPGFLGEKGADVKGIEDLTGFKVTENYAPDGSGPFFNIQDVKGDDIWFYWNDKPQAGVSVAVRKNANGSWDILQCNPSINAAFVKKLVDFAKVHRYVTGGEAIVWADGNNGCVHASANGPVTVSLPDGRTKTLEMKKGDTAFFMEQAPADAK